MIIASSRKTFVSTFGVSVALSCFFVLGLLLDNRASFEGAGHLGKALNVPLTPKTTAVVLVSLLCTAIPFLVHRAVRLVYSMPYSETPDYRIHQLIHPIAVFFQLWAMTVTPSSDAQTRGDILWTKAFLIYLGLILIAMVYLSSPYGHAT
jgi:hypothetical protein